MFASTADAPFIEGDTVRESRFRARNLLAALVAFVVGEIVALMLPKL